MQKMQSVKGGVINFMKKFISALMLSVLISLTGCGSENSKPEPAPKENQTKQVEEKPVELVKEKTPEQIAAEEQAEAERQRIDDERARLEAEKRAKKQAELEAQRKAFEENKTPIAELLTADRQPKLNDDITSINSFYAYATPPGLVSKTNSSQFDFPDSVLIFKTSGSIIDEIVCYPQRAGLNLTIYEIIPVIERFIIDEGILSDFYIENAAIFEGYPWEFFPTVYMWQCRVNDRIASIIIKERNGYCSAFAIFYKDNGTHYVPFFTSAVGYKVTQEGIRY